MDEADFKNAVAIVKTGAEGGVPFGEIEGHVCAALPVITNKKSRQHSNGPLATSERRRRIVRSGGRAPAEIDVVSGDAMAEYGNDGPTLKRQGLYPCEAEIARRLSQSEKHWRRIAPQLERQGLPKIDPVMKGRFWPAVEAFFRNRHGLGNMVGSQPDGEEMWDVP